MERDHIKMNNNGEQQNTEDEIGGRLLHLQRWSNLLAGHSITADDKNITSCINISLTGDE